MGARPSRITPATSRTSGDGAGRCSGTRRSIAGPMPGDTVLRSVVTKEKGDLQHSFLLAVKKTLEILQTLCSIRRPSISSE